MIRTCYINLVWFIYFGNNNKDEKDIILDSNAKN